MEQRRVLWEQKITRKVFFATFGRELVLVKLLLLAHFGARKDLFTGLVECGGMILYLLLSSGKNQAHPFTPHRETGQSDTQKHGNQVGGATSGATLSFETRNTYTSIIPSLAYRDHASHRTHRGFGTHRGYGTRVRYNTQERTLKCIFAPPSGLSHRFATTRT